MNAIKKLVRYITGEEIPETLSDTVLSKKLFIDGKQIKSCQSVLIDMDVADKDVRTKVICTFVVKKDSLKIEDNKISFELF